MNNNNNNNNDDNNNKVFIVLNPKEFIRLHMHGEWAWMLIMMRFLVSLTLFPCVKSPAMVVKVGLL